MSRNKKAKQDVKQEDYSQWQGYDNTNPIDKIKIDIKCKNDRQKKLLESLRDNTITFCEGSAGTGKTFVTLSHALKELKSGNFRKIVLVKSVTTLNEESLGFLKGDLATKLEPIMYSYTGNIEKIIGKRLSEDLLAMGKIEWMPIAYLRGVSIDDAFIIIDETQNISIDNIRTILSRIGEGSKMVLLGDIKQKDIKNKKNSALEFIMEHFVNIEGIGAVRFEKEHIIRHPIIEKFEHRFDELEEKGVLKNLLK
jgi:phosphate starvation-inducible PhoH-like protein